MNEESLFHQALQQPDAASRAAFLDQACANQPQLRARIERLLQAHDAPASLFDKLAVEIDTTLDPAARPSGNNGIGEDSSRATLPPPEGPDTRIGPYRLLQQIGEGGMGTVWMAEQNQPVRRKVALKIIKPGMDSRHVIARFEAERQALALMNHVNIAHVLDGGTTENGRPYFVMELIHGVPITKYCDDSQLTLRERLGLFVQVCQAIQHAHQKGIIHRDVKPSNVLVTLCDGKPVPKVIDFGVAKAVEQRLTERTMFTQFGAIIGTFEYMSPEQAENSALGIDTRSDIYSLGVLLYELLTGTTPLECQRLRTASYAEIVRLIREEEPPKPSTRLSHSETLPARATARKMAPLKLAKLVRGDLDWIVMKALEKDRGRRYETANAFAADVQRYLHDEPVLACPPSRGYRLRKFARKHRAALVSTTAITLLLLVGLSASLWQMFRAIAAEGRTREERDAKDVALKAEQQARQQAFAALRSMTEDVVEKKFYQGEVLTEDDRGFLRSVVAQYDAFAALKGDDADSRAMRAEGRLRVGNVRYRLVELREAEQDYDQALSIYTQLAAGFPNSSVFRKGLADCHHNRGLLLKDTGRLTEAERDHEQSLSIRKQLAADLPSRPDFLRDLVASYNSLALLLITKGSAQEAEKYIDRALSIQKQLAADFPDRPDFRRDLANNHNNRGSVRQRLRRFREAEQDLTQAVSILKQLAADFPNSPDFRRDLARNLSDRAFMLSAAGRSKEAERDHDRRAFVRSDADRTKEVERDQDQALSIRKQLAADFPSRPEFHHELAKGYLSRGMHLSAKDRREEAEQHYNQAVSIFKQLAADFPNRPEFREHLARSHLVRGMLLRRTGRPEEAEKDFDQTLSIRKQLAADFSDQWGRRNGLLLTYVSLASFLAQQGDWASAKRLLLEGQPYHLAAVKSNPQNPNYRQNYRKHVSALIGVHAGLLEQQDAVRIAETCRDLGWNAPADAYDAACFLSRCIPIVAKHDKLDDEQRKQAVQFYGDTAMRLLREAVSKGYKDVLHMKKDTDLAPLLQREDFRKLVAELEGKGE